MQPSQNDLSDLMHNIRSMTCQMKPMKNLTFGEYTIMCIIKKRADASRSEELTPTKLNELLGTKKSATSRTLTTLVKKGYVRREADKRDHRIISLGLTELGDEILKEESVTYRQLSERVTRRMGKEELAQMLSSMGRLSGILEEEVKRIQTTNEVSVK